MFQIVFCQKKISFSRCIGCTWQTKISFGRNYSKYFFLFFILQLFLAAFFWFFFTSLFFICCICAIVLLNKIDKKMFQKKVFFIEVSFSVKIIGFEDLESRDNGSHVLLLCFWSTNMTCDKQRSNFMEEKTPYVLFFVSFEKFHCKNWVNFYHHFKKHFNFDYYYENSK